MLAYTAAVAAAHVRARGRLAAAQRPTGQLRVTAKPLRRVGRASARLGQPRVTAAPWRKGARPGIYSARVCVCVNCQREF